MRKLVVIIFICICFSMFLFSNAEAETLKSECYFGPYAGYHYFLHGSDYKDKPEIGINFEKYLEKPWSYQLSLG
ncbi:hypothetical protein KA977_12450, partial [Candidatus Dependentiae bacterium]|nr:hypothetical protein [Candidatus Dependentiae bacterium]